MCIIVYKPKQKPLPKKEILQNCFNNNDDGAGYMYAKNNQVFFKKGFLTFDSFYKELKKDYEKNKLDNNNLVMHFRIGTSGGINKEKTHPFIISNNLHDLDKLSGSGKSCMVHNGILSDYVNNNKELSDTQNFTKDFLYPVLKLANWNFKNDYVKKLIQQQIGNTNKIIILDKNDNIYKYGEFIEDNGIYYSNTTYNYSYKNYYSNYYSSYYDDYKNWQLPFEDKKEKAKNKNELRPIDAWSEAIEFNDGYYIEPFNDLDNYKYYINDNGEIYQEDIKSKNKSLIGRGEVIKLY